jgi:hypothetical protein
MADPAEWQPTGTDEFADPAARSSVRSPCAMAVSKFRTVAVWPDEHLARQLGVGGIVLDQEDMDFIGHAGLAHPAGSVK